MVRLSKQKQEKLENIMNLVQELGVDRVLQRLRQTKMMSREVLDDMREWETDYEKRVALLGFLVAPEGKRAFGALFELAKVHEEQVKLQEEQERMRQEQLAQHPQSVERKPVNYNASPRQSNIRGGASNMKNKLRAQMSKKREVTAPPAQNNNTTTTNGTTQNQGKAKKGPKKKDEKEDPLLEEAARTIQEAERVEKEKKRIEAYRSQLKANETASNTSGQRSPRKTPTPVNSEAQPVSSPTSPKKSDDATVAATNATEKSTKSFKNNEKNAKKGIEPGIKHRKIETKQEDAHTNKISPDEKQMKEEPSSTEGSREVDPSLNEDTKEEVREDGHWGRVPAVEEDDEDEEDNVDNSEMHKENERNEERNADVVIEDAMSADRNNLTNQSSMSCDNLSDDDSSLSKPPHKKMCEELLMLYNEVVKFDSLSRSQTDKLVTEWRMLRSDQQDVLTERESQYKIIQDMKEQYKKLEFEKERISKEKDKYVFKEFELQQKLQELHQKHKTLREDHDTLRQGNYQIQQNAKKANKIHQEMKRKIAKLESKIKSMDKVTVRRGTQTDDHQDKDVYEALRMAEDNLTASQSELHTVTSKLKSLSQEVDELKKQVNIKGREINKRERKSKKEEEHIRLVSRERDAMEVKLRKITEQMEYYKGLMESKGKPTSKKLPEKKEIKVQRCASGRHVLVKSVASLNNGNSQHYHHHDIEYEDKYQTRSSRSGGSVKSQPRTPRQLPADKPATTTRKSSLTGAGKVNDSSTEVSKSTTSTNDSKPKQQSNYTSSSNVNSKKSDTTNSKSTENNNSGDNNNKSKSPTVTSKPKTPNNDSSAKDKTQTKSDKKTVNLVNSKTSETTKTKILNSKENENH